jgi:hypothetical protein
VARELRTGTRHKLWLAEGAPEVPPYDGGEDALFVAFSVPAELSCHLALGWPLPVRILDLYAEYRCLQSGRRQPNECGLLDVLYHFGLDGLPAVEKLEMRDLAIRGGPYTDAERAALLAYCETDVDALARLLPVILPYIDLPRALLRGRYMAAVTRMEWTGTPLDGPMLTRLREHWTEIIGRLIATINREYKVYVPTGQRTLDPARPTDAAILQEAAGLGLDPYRLAEAVNYLWAEEREALRDPHAARRKARRVTGLTRKSIFDHEHAGRDHSHQRGLDVQARDLADAYPELGIGPGYDPDAPDAIDHAGQLWEVLRDREERPRRKSDPALLRRAAERLAACPEDEVNYLRAMSFSQGHFEAYLDRNGIAWPRLASGALALDADTFDEMAKVHPAKIRPLKEVRSTCGKLRLVGLTVGSDGRNRCSLMPFGSCTGRNQPSNASYIFGPSCCLRCLIRPGPGRALAYIDWSAQEIGIAAALSKDAAMQEAYATDPYLWLARAGGFAPAGATKQTHGTLRELFKVVYLAANYGMGVSTLAAKINRPESHARQLLLLHRERFATFWAWSDGLVNQALLHGWMQTVFGWRIHEGPKITGSTYRNFPMQAHGAEMMRLACCLATERGIDVCAPIHDALLVEGPAEGIEDVVDRTQAAMREASEIVLPGFPLRTDARIVRYPDRYVDERGRPLWETLCRILEAIDKARPELSAAGSVAW